MNSKVNNMAKLERPKRRVGKGAPPPIEQPSQNLSKTPNQEVTTLNFRVPKDFKKEFKQYALDHDISMVDLVMKCFEYYKKQ